MGNARKRMTASLLAFAIVAVTVPANVNWEDALWDTSIVAKAANHTASGLRSLSTSANQWYSDDSNTTALTEVNGGAALLNTLHIAIMNADDYLNSIYDDTSSLDQNGEEIYTTLETAFNAAKAALNGSTQTAPTVTTAPSALNLTYSGSAQALVSAGAASGGEMQYALGTAAAATGTYTTTIPSGKNADIYYVWYKAVNGEKASVAACVSVTIKPASLTGISATGFTGQYDGAPHSITVTAPVGATVTYSTDGVNYSATDPTFQGVTNGAQTVYYKVTKANYTTVTGSATITITKADNSWNTAPVLVSDQYYDDTEIPLIEPPGTPRFGEATAVKYAVTTSDTAPAADAESWTTYDNIKADASGTYYVWYKIAEGTDWNAIAPTKLGAVTVTKKSEQSWTLSMPDYVYDGTAHEPTINGTAYGKLTYTYFTAAGVCLGSTAPTEPGDYRVSVSSSGDKTHFSKLESVEYTIKGAKLAAGNTVSFKEKVEFNFLVEATDVDTVEGAYVVFTYDHYGEKMTVKKPINKSDKNGKYYRVRLPLTASEMAIDIKAELYLPTLDKPVDTKTRSIKNYAEAAIKSSLDGAEVLKAMLNYGGYTQTALSNNTTLLANSGEGILTDVSNVAPKSETPFVRPIAAQGAKVTYKGSTVITTSDVFVRHYFTVATTLTTAELNAVKIQVGDKVLALKDLPKNNTGYYYDVAPQLAYELDKENDKIVVYGFSGAETADSENAINIENYNVIDYCEAIANNTNQSAVNKNMVKALYAYYKAAKAYVDKRA